MTTPETTVPKLKWSDVFNISSEWGDQEKQDLVKSLNLLEPLQMMQETLGGVVAGKLFNFQPDKITICPAPKDAQSLMFYDGFSRNLILPPDLQVKDLYLDEDNKEHRLSLTRILFHEPQHAIDPDFTETLRDAVNEVVHITGCSPQEACEMLSEQMMGKMDKSSQVPQEQQAVLMASLYKILGTLQWNEHIAVSRENPVMETFFGETPRAYYNNFKFPAEKQFYRMEVPAPTQQYFIDQAKDVAQPIREICTDIKNMDQAIASEYPAYEIILTKKRDAAEKNFPNGKLRQFEK